MATLPSTLDRPAARAPYFDGTQACISDPDAWFPAKGNNRAITAAKRECAECPFRDPCLAFALADSNLEGVWGGTTDADRRAIRRRARDERQLANRRAARAAARATQAA